MTWIHICLLGHREGSMDTSLWAKGRNQTELFRSQMLAFTYCLWIENRDVAIACHHEPEKYGN